MNNVRKNVIFASARKVKAKKKDDLFKNATQRTLWISHLEEILRKKAIDFPRGGAEGDTFLSSVTDKGRLTTTIQPKSKRVSHRWVRQK